MCGTDGYMAPEVKGVDERDDAYGFAVDWFSYGVVLYELAEHEMPFGRSPKFESLSDEYRQPDLLDEYGVEIPELYDLLAGLLDWSPDERFGVQALRSHPYFTSGNADWELADRGRMPSPMMRAFDTRKGSAAEKWPSAKRVLASGPAKSDARALDIASDLARSQQLANLADGDVPSGGISLKQKEELEAQAFELHVEGWEYVSEHALAREYVMGAADVISIV